MGGWKGRGLQGRAWAWEEDQPLRKPSLALSKPQWPHLHKGDDNSPHLVNLGGFGGLLHVSVECS